MDVCHICIGCSWGLVGYFVWDERLFALVAALPSPELPAASVPPIVDMMPFASIYTCICMCTQHIHTEIPTRKEHIYFDISIVSIATHICMYIHIDIHIYYICSI